MDILSVNTEDWKKIQALWETYDRVKDLDDVARAGFVACGTGKIQPKTKLVKNLRRCVVRWLRWQLKVLGEIRLETDGGHIFGVLVLADLVNRYFPDWLPDETYALVRGALLYHEADELTGGDQLDDGRLVLSEQASNMMTALEQMLGQTPNVNVVKEVICLAEQMSGTPYDMVDHSNVLMSASWWVKALDKAEAPLQNGRYRKLDAVGRISQKDDPSERDLETMQELGTDDIAFNWAWASARYLQGTVLWVVIIAMILDVYPYQEIPGQFYLPRAE